MKLSLLAFSSLATFAHGIAGPPFQEIADPDGGGMKCQYSGNHRAFKEDVTAVPEDDQVEACYNLCVGSAECNYFSIGPHAGVMWCIGCKTATWEDHDDFKAYAFQLDPNAAPPESPSFEELHGAHGLGNLYNRTGDGDNNSNGDGVGVKCNWVEQDDFRLQRIPAVGDTNPDSYLKTIDDCYQACVDFNPDNDMGFVKGVVPEGRPCEMFSWGVDPGHETHHFRDVCILCVAGSTLEAHDGFHTFDFDHPSFNFKKNPPAGGGGAGDDPVLVGGDPHFQRWKGKDHGSFHGECDLVLAHSDSFHNGAGVDIHVRTTIDSYFSYIETAAVRVGKDVLEFHKNKVILNGHADILPTDLPYTFQAGEFQYSLTNAQCPEGKNPKYYQYYKMELGDKSSILFKFYKKFLTLSIDGHPTDFADSVGLLGEYHTGEMLDRAGRVVNDYDSFGPAWQVSPEEPKLFVDDRSPQLPFERCRLPTAPRPSRRRLRGDSVLAAKAAEACANAASVDLCVDDIMTTGDLGLADIW